MSHPQPPKQKLVLATISLHHMAGGLEKNIIRIANFFARNGYDSHIVTFDIPPATAFYDIDKSVTWHQVGNSEPHGKISFKQRLNLILNIRRAIAPNGDTPTTLIAFHHGILVRLILAALCTRTRIFCSERNSLSLYNHIRAKKWNINFMMLALVKKIIVQFPAYINDYPKCLKPRITVIPNVVDETSQTLINRDKPRYTLLSVGRLCAQKNFELLIESFAKIAAAFPDWDLKIVGEGSSRKKLEHLIASHKLESRIFLTGKSSNMADIYLDTDLFCTTSQWEGFPNALAESMAHGIPPIGLYDCAGVRDLIDADNNGLLSFTNSTALAQSLAKLMADKQLRTSLGQAAREKILHYKESEILPLWENLVA